MARRFARGQRGKPVTVSLNQDFDEIVIDEIVDWAVEQVAPATENYAKSIAAVDTGRMKRETFVRVRKLGRGVASIEGGSDVPYFLFVEYGTGTRGRATGSRGDVGQFPRPRGYNYGPSSGNRAQPFIRPALNWALGKFFKLGGTV